MNRIKSLRLKNGYKSQKELADVLYVNQTAVSQWERGVTIPSGQMLLKLSDLFGVSIDYLLGSDASGEFEESVDHFLSHTNQKKMSTPEFEGGLSDKEIRIAKWFSSLPPETQKAILTLGDAPKDLGE